MSLNNAKKKQHLHMNRSDEPDLDVWLFLFLLQGLLIEHTGRRPLFWAGYGVMSVSWVLVTVTLNLQVKKNKKTIIEILQIVKGLRGQTKNFSASHEQMSITI